MNELSKSLGLAVAALVASACSANTASQQPTDTGGSPAAGQSTGGGSAQSGAGGGATGGGSTAGGSGNGGSSTGGSATGGAGTTGGSSPTGGTSTGGGSPIGGSNTGGGTTGGSSPTGGVSTGGGSTTGGSNTGGGTSTTGGTATGGTATGGTATGGTATGGTSSAVVPTQVGSQYALSLCNVTFQVDPAVGARITTLAFSGTNLLTGSTVNSTNWGSTFWTSPQNAWKPANWPPIPEIDNLAYTGGISGTHIVLDGPTSSAMNVRVSKDFSADATSCWISITYTIHATAANTMAPWQITRLFPGGLVFFPSGTTAMTPGPLTLTTGAGATWFNSATLPSTAGKAYGDGSGGWIAYVRNGVLFLVKFTDVPVSAQAIAQNEGEIEVYAGQGLGYFELEVQGPYTAIAAGGSLPWTVKWRVVSVPSSVTVGVGSQTLVDFAQQQAAL